MHDRHPPYSKAGGSTVAVAVAVAVVVAITVAVTVAVAVVATTTLITCSELQYIIWSRFLSCCFFAFVRGCGAACGSYKNFARVKARKLRDRVCSWPAVK